MLSENVKNIVLEYTLKYLNKQIKEIYEGDIGEGIYKKELLDKFF